MNGWTDEWIYGYVRLCGWMDGDRWTNRCAISYFIVISRKIEIQTERQMSLPPEPPPSFAPPPQMTVDKVYTYYIY